MPRHDSEAGLDPSLDQFPDSLAAPPPPAPGVRKVRWLLLAALAALGFIGLSRCGGGSRSVSRSPLLLDSVDLSGGDAAAAGRWQAVQPPVSLDQAEAAARGASLGRLPAAQARAAISYRDSASGEEVTQVILRYADAEAAQSLQAVGAPLLERAFGLIRAPIQLAGVQDATSWTSSQYAAISFRHGAVLTLIGSTRSQDAARLQELAERARDRLLAAPVATPQDG